MFLLFPKKIRITTSLTAKQCREKMTRDMVEYTRRPSLVAASSFIKAHRLENCYYGSCVKKDGVIHSEIFYHRAKKHDGSSAGFFGTVTKTEDGKGAVIEGMIRRTAWSMAMISTWFTVTFLFAVLLTVLKITIGAVVTLGVMAAGILLMTYDRSESFIRDYLKQFEDIGKS